MARVPRYHSQQVAWGATQGASAAASAVLSLAATGSGSWAAVDAHEVLRQGAFDYQGGQAVTHTLKVRYAGTGWGSGSIAFRLYDVTNSLTLATATPAAGSKLATATAFGNLPAADARIELQYSLVSPLAIDFYSALWEMSRWP